MAVRNAQGTGRERLGCEELPRRPPHRVNVVERTARRLDAVQQRHTTTAVIFGVLKKFGDDNAGSLAGSLAHSAFGSVFPLLLLLVTGLGLVLGSHAALRSEVLHSTLGQFPVIGTDLARNIRALHRHSVEGMTVGVLGLVWGSLGLAENGIFTMQQVWNLPGPERPNYPKRLVRSVGFLLVLAVGLVLSTFLAAVVPASHAMAFVVVAAAGSAVVNVAEYLFAFRVLTPGAVPTRQLLPGAVFAGIGWTVLQEVGGFVVEHYLRNDSPVFGLFAIVLGLFAWIYLAVELTVYAAEANVVLARRLWPRAMVQPPLTEADRRVMAAQATQNRRRPEQLVTVQFEGVPMTEDQFLAGEEDRRTVGG